MHRQSNTQLIRRAPFAGSDHGPRFRARSRVTVAIVVAVLLAACSSVPARFNNPKSSSVALAHPEDTRLGVQFDGAARQRSGESAFRIISVGVDGFLARAQMIDAAEKTLDLQYFIFRGDETGRLLTDAVMRAADRGVRVRVLVDDGDTVAGDEQISTLDAHPNIEIRIFNPFVYRGHSKVRRTIEFMFNASRLDYRMHNKLLVVDNAVALIGGRNIGNQYFQMDPDSQFADDDVFAGGPIAMQLSATFDEYWNSRFAVPAAALDRQQRSRSALAERRVQATERPERHMEPLKTDGVDYVARLATGEPYAGIISGRLPLVWAQAQVISDSPDKKNVDRGELPGRLMAEQVLKAASMAQSELLMITPYLVPAPDELAAVQDLRGRNVRVGILTNSLKSSPDIIAQSGYVKFRVQLLKEGVELYEIRSLLGSTRGSGETALVSRYGNYGLHAKLLVFDRKRIFIGSMNFDQRSKHLNTEIGLIIDSPELAEQTVTRFDHMVRPDNVYAVAWREAAAGVPAHLVWDTSEDGKAVEYTQEPARSSWQRFDLRFLSWLPLDREL
jgi:putative cardiolipin synthase